MHLQSCYFSCFAKTNDTWYIEGTRTHTSFMTATVHLSGYFYARRFSTYIKGTNSFWTIHFVAGPRHKMNTNFLRVCRDFSYCLRSITHKKDPMLFTNITNLFHRLDNTCFVISPHNRH